MPNCDIVVTDDLGARPCAVQVKTHRDLGSDGGWHMSAKHERLDASTLFYCFVDLGRAASDAPTVYVVPAAIVADVLHRSHRAWLEQPGAWGQQYNDGPFRRFLPDYSKLGLPESRGWLDRYRDA